MQQLQQQQQLPLLQWHASVRAAETMLNNSSAKICTLAIVCRASEIASDSFIAS
jgi:hypothetical protein